MDWYKALNVAAVILVVSAVFWLQTTFVTTFRDRIGNLGFVVVCLVVIVLMVMVIAMLSR